MTERNEKTTHLAGRYLALARLLWVLLALLCTIILLLAVPVRLTHLRGDPYSFSSAFLQIGISADFFAAYFTVIESLAALFFMAVGGLIILKASRDRMAILVSATFISLGVSSPVPDALAQTVGGWHWPVLIVRILSFNLALLVFFLFPDGRFVPSWSRWLVALSALYGSLWLVVPGLIPPAAILAEATSATELRKFVPLILPVIVGVASQLYRYRYISSPGERQQTKWVVLGIGAFFAVASIAFFVFGLSPAFRRPGPSAVTFIILVGPLLLLAVGFIPMSTAVAILRFRLWDISIVIRRTLLYSLLTTLLALIYLASVVSFQLLFTTITGQRSPVAIVISTLIIAALFNPLRYRIQDIIDRRLYRSKYDASQTLAAFAATARDEVDLERLTSELLRAVQETMQPESLSLWLRRSPTSEQPRSPRPG